MTQEQKDAAWRSLPEDFKKEVKEVYEALECDSKYKDGYAQAILMRTLFGKHNLTASEEQTIEESAMDKHISHASEKQRLKEYAAKNRKRLEAQVVNLGDVVRVLKGQFAGKKGIVKGIMVLGNDFNDPYYEVDMECEVPDEYKCRKTLISPNNVIGGLTKSDFEVIGKWLASDEKPRYKVGDCVEVAINTGEIYPHGSICLVMEVCKDQYGYKYRLDSSKSIWISETALEAYAEKQEPKKGAIHKLEKELQELKAKHLDRMLHPEKDCTYEVTLDKISHDWLAYRKELVKEITPKVINAVSDNGVSSDFCESVIDKVSIIVNGIVEQLKGEK